MHFIRSRRRGRRRDGKKEIKKIRYFFYVEIEDFELRSVLIRICMGVCALSSQSNHTLKNIHS